MSTTTTTEEMLESLTGFDEVAIGRAFGAEISDLATSKPTMFLRALVFVQERRNGANDTDAKAKCMGLTLKEANEYFAESQGEVMPEEPVTEEGKDD